MQDLTITTNLSTNLARDNRPTEPYWEWWHSPPPARNVSRRLTSANRGLKEPMRDNPSSLQERCSRYGHHYLSRSPSRLSRLVDALRLPQVYCKWITYLRTPTESISSVLGALSQLANTTRAPIFYKPRSLHLVNDLRGFETWLKGLVVDHSATLQPILLSQLFTPCPVRLNDSLTV
jgi:hypothetical protein